MAISRLASHAHLDSLRMSGDPGLDGLVAAWFKEGDFPDPATAIRVLHRHSHAPTGDMAPPIRSYFERQPPMPRWVDEAEIRRGQELFEQWGLLIATALFCASLPTTYASANGARVLARTGRLMTNPKRRLFETGRLVFDAMSVGGLEVGATGWQTVRRVRLIHSAIRALVLSDPGGIDADGDIVGPWDLAWGVPINQEDLLGVMLTMSVVVVEGLRKGGAEITDVDARSFLHVWNLIGYLIGIQEELLPVEYRDAEALFEKISRRQFAPSPDGRRLTEVLLEFIGDMLPPPLRHTLPQASLRHFLPPRTAEILDLPETNWTEHLVEFWKHTAQTVSQAESHSRLMRSFSEHAGRSIWRIVLDVGGLDDHRQLPIPTHLSDRWGL